MGGNLNSKISSKIFEKVDLIHAVVKCKMPFTICYISKAISEFSESLQVYTLAQGINATPRVFSTKTQDFTPKVLKSLVDVHLLSIGS